MKLFGKIPFEIRYLGNANIQTEEIEHIIKEVLKKSNKPNLPSISDIQSVFLNNKGSWEFVLTLYADSNYSMETIFIDIDSKEGYGYGTLTIAFEQSGVPKPNIVKVTCQELGITYKELGEAIGYSESAISNASRGKVSEQLSKAIELYIENIQLKKELEQSKKIKNTLKEWLK